MPSDILDKEASEKKEITVTDILNNPEGFRPIHERFKYHLIENLVPALSALRDLNNRIKPVAVNTAEETNTIQAMPFDHDSLEQYLDRVPEDLINFNSQMINEIEVLATSVFGHASMVDEVRYKCDLVGEPEFKHCNVALSYNYIFDIAICLSEVCDYFTHPPMHAKEDKPRQERPWSEDFSFVKTFSDDSYDTLRLFVRNIWETLTEIAKLISDRVS